jgi:hypothetical protein
VSSELKKRVLLIAYDPADTQLVVKALPRGCEETSIQCVTKT